MPEYFTIVMPEYFTIVMPKYLECVVHVSDFALRFPDPLTQRRGIHCVQVNDLGPEERASCRYCLKEIGRSYVRKISTRATYCDFQCYGAARPFRTDA
jgi:hypothetical protein